MAFIPSVSPLLRRVTSSSVSSVRCGLSPSAASAPSSRRSFLTTAAAAAAGLAFADARAALAEPTVGVEDVVVGEGAPFKSGDLVKLHYTLTTGGFQGDGGKIVDSSRKRGKPFSYKYDTGSVIQGWDQGVAGMRVGGRRRLVIPPELGYGARGAGGVISPNATLYFDIELLKVGY